MIEPSYPHHITQRGNRRQQTFFNDSETIETFRKHERTGRPIGDSSFFEKMEKLNGRNLKLGKPGPKPKYMN